MLNHRPDNSELLEAIEDAMKSISDAIESLRGYEDFEEWHSALTDILEEMQPMQAQLDAVVSAEWAEEVEDLRRQYYRDVL